MAKKKRSPDKDFRVEGIDVFTKYLGPAGPDTLEAYRITIYNPDTISELTNEYTTGAPPGVLDPQDWHPPGRSSRDLAYMMLLEAGDIIEDPEGYLEENTKGANAEQARAVRSWVDDVLELGEEMVDIAALLRKTPEALREVK